MLFRLKIQLKLIWAKTISEIIGRRLMRIFPAPSGIDEKIICFASFSDKMTNSTSSGEALSILLVMYCSDFMDPTWMLSISG